MSAAPLPPKLPYETIVTDGQLALAAVATRRRTAPQHILRVTVEHFGWFPDETAAWVDAVFRGSADPADPMPAGLHLRVPVLPS